MRRVGYSFVAQVCLAIGIGLVANIVPRQLISIGCVLGNSIEELTTDIDGALENEWPDYEANSGGGDEFADRQDYNSNCRGYTCSFRTSCGRAPLNQFSSNRSLLLPYIVNGQDALHGEWPSFARLEVDFGGGYSVSCGGTIVSDQHILTAAHCLRSERGLARRIKATLGIYSRRWSAQERVYSGRPDCVPRTYSKSTLQDDWAVITLDTRIRFTNYIQPACLPYNYNGRPKFQRCHVVGEGAAEVDSNGDRRLKEILQKMSVKPASCAKYGSYGNRRTQACYTKSTSHGDACSGDSGGPILCIDTTNRRWTVVAITSAGEAECNGKQFNWVGLYSRVTTLLPSIKTLCRV